VMPTADGEDTVDQLPMVVTVAGTVVMEADMAATAAASGEGMAPAEPEARRGEVHEAARAVEREEQAPPNDSARLNGSPEIIILKGFHAISPILERR